MAIRAASPSRSTAHRPTCHHLAGYQCASPRLAVDGFPGWAQLRSAGPSAMPHHGQ